MQSDLQHQAEENVLDEFDDDDDGEEEIILDNQQHLLSNDEDDYESPLLYNPAG